MKHIEFTNVTELSLRSHLSSLIQMDEATLSSCCLMFTTLTMRQDFARQQKLALKNIFIIWIPLGRGFRLETWWLILVFFFY